MLPVDPVGAPVDCLPLIVVGAYQSVDQRRVRVESMVALMTES
jgi:hypothetical protein